MPGLAHWMLYNNANNHGLMETLMKAIVNGRV